MRKAYRSPRQILMAAHCFGMGLKREQGAVQAITNKRGWENIGYEVESGDFRKTDENIEITRPSEHSPHPLSDNDEAKPFIKFSQSDNKREEITNVAENIREDIEEHGFDPDQILVILLGYKTQSEADEPADHLNQELGESIQANRVWEGDGNIFKKENKVTISRINRAKGNEAAMVYLTGLEYVDDVSSGASLVQRRNEAFVGMTRARGWCHISGVGESSAFEELRSVLDQVTASEPKMTFPAPDPQSLENEMESDSIATTFDEFEKEWIADSMQ